MTLTGAHSGSCSQGKLSLQKEAVSVTASAAPSPPEALVFVEGGMEPNTLCPDLPVFDLQRYLEASDRATPELQRLCEAMAQCLRNTSALVVRDPRVDSADNERFLSLVEDYFAQPTEAKMADVRPELSYQVGATPEGIEKPRCLHDHSIVEAAARLAPEHQPVMPAKADSKWRFFWRVGTRPQQTAYPELNADPVVPAAFPAWAQVMDTWGNKLLDAVTLAAEMVACGFGMEPNAFSRRMQQGPHLLAPTGSDLGKHSQLGTVFAGFHYDLNLLTIHGRSRYPGLYAWLREGRRIPVRIPEGCLLIQAGAQMEWLTGGAVKAGYHEVICTEGTLAAAEAAKQAGRPQWRVSSTVFSHVASDEVLRPLVPFACPEAVAAYPPLPAGEQVQRELAAINLKLC
ncbi:hypothetical protein N2152v2_004674 [Parachlorella kessleri]